MTKGLLRFFIREPFDGDETMIFKQEYDDVSQMIVPQKGSIVGFNSEEDYFKVIDIEYFYDVNYIGVDVIIDFPKD